MSQLGGIMVAETVVYHNICKPHMLCINLNSKGERKEWRGQDGA